MELKALSYNVHKFFNITKTQYFLQELKKMLMGLDIDFVFLQELRGRHPKSHGPHMDRNPLEYLADEIWNYYIYGKNAIYSKGDHGNAILSKYPFHFWENHDLSNHRWEKRSLLVGRPNLGGGVEINLCCTHLDLTEWGRKKQADKIRNYIENFEHKTAPVLLCGDFNDWKGRVAQKFVSSGYDFHFPGVTFPSFFPVLSLDMVFSRGIHVKRAETLKEEVWKKFSDHLPVYITFEV